MLVGGITVVIVVLACGTVVVSAVTVGTAWMGKDDDNAAEATDNAKQVFFHRITLVKATALPKMRILFISSPRYTMGLYWGFSASREMQSS